MFESSSEAMPEAAETVADWQAEAEKWKEQAAENERTAKENASAAQRLKELESSAGQKDAETAEKLKETETEAQQAVAEAKNEGAKSIAEWQAEAERWKALSTRNEQLAKDGLSAIKRLEKLEADAEAGDSKAAAEAEQLRQEWSDKAEEIQKSGDKSVEEWKAEAEKWKELNRKSEDLAKKNLAAASRVHKLEAEGKAVDEQTAQRVAELEAKTTEAQAKALRYEVATEMGVPQELRQFLVGTTKKEITEQADTLLATIEKNPPPPEEVETEDDEATQRATELAEAHKRAAEAEAKALRYEVATDKKLKPELAELLSANTREDLEKQADVLLSVTGGGSTETEVSTRARMPGKPLRSGAVPNAAPEVDSDELIRRIRRKQRGY